MPAVSLPSAFSFGTGFLGGLPGMGAASPTADSPLGALFQRLLPGPAFFAPALLYPTITLAAALAAAHTTAAVQAVAALPAVQVGLWQDWLPLLLVRAADRGALHWPLASCTSRNNFASSCRC